VSAREVDANFPGLVAVLNEHWRVVAGSCGIQWILQRRGKNDGQWRNCYFLRSRAGVLAYAGRREVGQVDAAALAILENLPEWFPEAGGYPWSLGNAAKIGR
jgi:hypothetical protein